MSDILWLADKGVQFPPVEDALTDPDGLLAVGGDLGTARLLEAYRSGIFPWYEEDQPILWWSPDPRCILYPQDLHVSRSLKKTLRKGQFKITANQAFAQVIEQCAVLQGNREGTWITEAMDAAFKQLHQSGIAHSVEVWEQERLVGGLYGIAMGRVFFGESMFSRRTDASKVALYALSQQLQNWGFNLIDCQVHSEHLQSLGAITIPRGEFMSHLKQHINDPTDSQWHHWHKNEVE